MVCMMVRARTAPVPSAFVPRGKAEFWWDVEAAQYFQQMTDIGSNVQPLELGRSPVRFRSTSEEFS